MLLLVLGVILLAMKFMEFGPVAEWSWLLVLAPFAGAVAWWAFADATGYTKRRAMEAEEKRKQDRIARQKENIGTNFKRK